MSQYLTENELAEELKLSRSFLWALRKQGLVNAGREVKHPLWRSGARTLGNLCLFRGIGPRMDTGANKECIETWNNGTGFGNGCFGTG